MGALQGYVTGGAVQPRSLAPSAGGVVVGCNLESAVLRGEALVATGREGQDTAGLGSLRASDADREQIVDLLKAAFFEGLLTRDELGERVGGALTARTHADLAMVTAGIPPGVAAASPPASALVRTRRRPGRRGLG